MVDSHLWTAQWRMCVVREEAEEKKLRLTLGQGVKKACGKYAQNGQ